MEPGAIAWIEGRDAANPYRVGPSLGGARGQLLAGEQALLPVPVGEWVHYELTCTLGQTAATYDLAVTLPGQPPRHFPGLAYGSTSSAGCSGSASSARQPIPASST